MRQVEKLSGLPARSVDWRVFSAFRGDTALGYVVLDNVIGKFELISYAVAINPDASVKQVEILAYRESHGFEIRSPHGAGNSSAKARRQDWSSAMASKMSAARRCRART